MTRHVPAALLLAAALLHGQTDTTLRDILDRLDRVERENRQLRSEVEELRRQLAPAPAAEGAPASQPSAAETAAVQANRIEELAQTKVETSQRMPLSVTGMLLFNSFLNGRRSGTSQDPITAQAASGAAYSGASVRQTVVGLAFHGPQLPGGGQVEGSLYMDFASGGRDASNHVFRIRTATIDLAWKNTTVSVGQDKPIIAPREPDSLAQVSVSPLTGAGNLWDWQPQARVEQRFHFNEHSGLRAQLGLYRTSETDATVPAAFARTLEYTRPGYEGRLNFWQASGGRRFEFAPGYHLSDTHVAGHSVPSRIVSLDWLAKPIPLLQVTGAWFTGRNPANLGALRQGFTILANGTVIPIHSSGGWTQLAIFAAPRLTFHFFGGQERDRERDLNGAGISRNFIYAGNVVYRLAPNLLVELETSQVRTRYVASGLRINNHYDLALAYLF